MKKIENNLGKKLKFKEKFGKIGEKKVVKKIQCWYKKSYMWYVGTKKSRPKRAWKKFEKSSKVKKLRKKFEKILKLGKKIKVERKFGKNMEL